MAENDSTVPTTLFDVRINDLLHEPLTKPEHKKAEQQQGINEELILLVAANGTMQPRVESPQALLRRLLHKQWELLTEPPGPDRNKRLGEIGGAIAAIAHDQQLDPSDTGGYN